MRYNLNKKQIDFVKWIYNNKLYTLTRDEREIVDLVIFEDNNQIKRGYCKNSTYQIILNKIRDNYLKEYIEKLGTCTNDTITSHMTIQRTGTTH